MALEVYCIANAMKNGPKVGAMGMEKRAIGLLGVIARLYSLKGMGEKAIEHDENGRPIMKDGKPVPSKEVHLAIIEMDKELALRYPFLTMGEVQYALESGVKGQLDDEPTYLNVANYSRWLKEYRQSGERQDADLINKTGQRVQEPAHLLPVGDVIARNTEYAEAFAKTLFDEIKRNGRFDSAHTDMAVAMVYNYLRKEGRMEKPAADLIQDAFSQAAKLVREGEDKNRTAIRVKRILLQNFMLSHVNN